MDYYDRSIFSMTGSGHSSVILDCANKFLENVSMTSEGSKPVRIRTYLLERPQKTKTDMYKFAPRSPRLQAPNRNKPTQIRAPSWKTPQRRTYSRRGVQIRVGLEPADDLQEVRFGKRCFGQRHHFSEWHLLCSFGTFWFSQIFSCPRDSCSWWRHSMRTENSWIYLVRRRLV